MRITDKASRFPSERPRLYHLDSLDAEQKLRFVL